MTDKEMLNLGCGRCFHKDWINVDYSSCDESVIAYDLTKKLPFEDNSFEVIYHSHLLEHFEKSFAPIFLKECYRVLKKGGIIRIAVPDLEKIARLYLEKLEEQNEKDYEWIMLEMYDQTVRTKFGGEMLEYFKQDKIENLDFVLSRIGFEGQNIIDEIQKRKLRPKRKFSLKRLFKNLFAKKRDVRTSGEIHQWMYDKFSLSLLLKKVGFVNVKVVSAYESDIENFSSYHFDVMENNKIRKPDSLFIEAKK